MTNPARIILADDHKLVTDGLRMILANDERWEVVSEARNGTELLETLNRSECQLIITDLNMPGMRGHELIRTIKSKYPDIPVLVLTMHDEQEIVQEILLAEAEGYLLKNSGKAEIVEAVCDLLEGKTHFESAIMIHLLKDLRKHQQIETQKRALSPRETEILKLIVAEYNSREIAERLHISKQTVDTHRAHIMEKTGAKTLVGLIKFAIQNDLENETSI
jgi:DNA-binding NarL/FixJ family response regulator